MVAGRHRQRQRPRLRDDGLDDDTAYHYRVRAANEAGGSGYSNVASATTPPLARFTSVT